MFSDSIPANFLNVHDIPLISAVKNGNVEKVRRLVNNGVDVNKTDKDGYTPLHHAAKVNVEIVEILMENGANFISSPTRITPLYSAIVSGKNDIVEFFLKRGFIHNGSNRSNSLHTMIGDYDFGNINISMLGIFLKYGFDINGVNIDGDTPLHIAVVGKKLEVIQELVYNGANIRAMNKYDSTPYDIATRLNDKKIKDFFDLQESISDVK